MPPNKNKQSGSNPSEHTVIDLEQFRQHPDEPQPVATKPAKILGGVMKVTNDDEVLYRSISHLFHRQGLIADMTRGAINQGRIDFYRLGCPRYRVALITTSQPWKIMPEHKAIDGSWHADLSNRFNLRDVVVRRINFGHNLEDPAQSAWNALSHALEELQKNDSDFFLILQDPQKSTLDQILLFDGVAYDLQPRRLRLVNDAIEGAMVTLEAANQPIDPFENYDHPAWKIIGRAPAGVLAAAEAYAPGRLYEFLTRPIPITVSTECS